MKNYKLTRRQGLNLGLLSLLSTYLKPTLIFASDRLKAVNRLSWLANKTTKNEGAWASPTIEGSIPKEIKGTLLRVGPGQKETGGTILKHFFDGDAYLQAFQFGYGEVDFKANFIETSDRLAELKAGKMLFDEFGTEAPKKTRRLKNQPNVNIVPWRGDFLALSEGGHPSLLSGKDRSFVKYWDFNGTLDKSVTFTAHPKFEQNGVGYGYGTKKGITKALVVYKMNPQSGDLEELYNLPQKKVHMIHDMMMTSDYLLFYIAPAFFKLTDIIFDRGTMADALQFKPSMGGRLIVLDKSGTAKPIEIKMPGYMSFHHGNAYQEGNSVCFTSFVAKDDSVLKVIAKWNASNHMATGTPSATQFRVNLETQKVEEERVIADHHDFPSFDQGLTGQKIDELFAVKMGSSNDPMSFLGVSKISITKGILKTFDAGRDETFGEPVFKQIENKGFLFVPGYHRGRDESFLQIFDATELNLISKIWMGGYYPLGFHGNFVTS
jgi:all-trans-8'-apo-beta-carotenal 15,15'-oxygenase